MKLFKYKFANFNPNTQSLIGASHMQSAARSASHTKK